MKPRRSNKKYKTLRDIFTNEELEFYLSHPIEFIEDVIFRADAVINGGNLSLTPQQKKIAQSVLNGDWTSVAAGRGIGKAQPYNTLTPTPTGMKEFGNLKKGDKIFGSDGKPTEVKDIFEQGEREVYRVTFDDGSSTVCCKEHLWNVKGRNERRYNKDWKTVELQELIEDGIKSKFKSGREDRKWEVPTLQSPVKYKKQNVFIDGYTLGMWLGDGSANKSEITNIDSEPIDQIRKKREIYKTRENDIQWSIPGLKAQLKKYHLSNKRSHERFIPNEYKYNSASIRKELLRGILDADGTVNSSGTVRYGSTSKKLLDDVVELARSLGYKVHSKGEVKTGRYKNGNKTIDCKPYYRCTITTKPKEKLFYIQRKQNRIKDKEFRYYGKKWIDSVEKIGVEKTRCIQVTAENSLYLTTDFIVTHNTAFLAWLIIWWMTVHATPKVVAIAPSFPQLQSVLWPEINKWLKRSAVRDCFKWGKKRIYLRTDPSNSFAEPRTATKEEAMQGLHEDNLLVIIDEASGVDDKIWDVVQGSLTNLNNKVCLMSNPTRISGFFYDSHHGEKELWNTFQFSSVDSPVVDRKYIKRMQFKYVHGTQIHDMYKMHVLGQFPSGDPDAFFTLNDVMKMIGNVTVKAKGAVEIGADIARKGDDETVIAVRQGGYFFSAQELGLYKDGEPSLYSAGKTTVPEAIQMVIDAVIASRKVTGYQGIIKVKVDDGGVGGGVTDGLDLIANKYALEVIPCNFGGSGRNYEHDDNEATHMWSNLSDFKDDIRIPHDKELMEELVSRRWFIAKNGKRLLESKRDYKKYFKGGSPDRADAVVLCMADAERAKLMSESFQHSVNNIQIVKGYQIMGKGQIHVGVFRSPKGNTSIVGVSKWNNQVGVFMHKTGSTYQLAEIIKALRTSRIVGSDSMFGAGMSSGLEFMTMGVPIINSFNYNEGAAIMMLDSLMDTSDFAIAEECSDLANQLRTWKQSLSKSELAESHGGCYALLLVLSEFRTTSNLDQLTGMCV